VVVALLMIGCEASKDGITPVSIEKDWLKYEVGQTWTYKRTFINQGSWELMKVPDTLYGYSEFAVTKDTAFEQAEWLIIEGNDYEVNRDSISKTPSRYAVSFTDSSLRVYQFKDSVLGFSWGPFKRRAIASGLTKSDFSKYSIARSKILAEKAYPATYDPIIFSDLFVPIVFGVDSGYTWRIRAENDPHQNLPIEKRYLGRETIHLPSGVFDAYKFELLTGKYLFVSDLFIFQWYDSRSLLKRLSEYGSSDIQDDSGVTIGTINSWEIFEYLGTGNVNPDTLVPWGSN